MEIPVIRPQNSISSIFLKTGRVLLSILLVLLLQACGSKSGNGILGFFGFGSAPQGSAHSDYKGKSMLRILLTDYPLGDVKITKVIVEIDSVKVHQVDGDWITVAELSGSNRFVDLLSLQNGKTRDLGALSIPAGDYDQIRLLLGANHQIEVDGVLQELRIPSGAHSGLKIPHKFSMASAGTFTLTLDFDAQKSIKVKCGGGDHRSRDDHSSSDRRSADDDNSDDRSRDDKSRDHTSKARKGKKSGKKGRQSGGKSCRKETTYILRPVLKVLAGGTATIVPNPPTLVMPAQHPDSLDTSYVRPSAVLAPQTIGGQMVPISAVYDAGMDLSGTTMPDGSPVPADGRINFPGEPAELHFSYDAAKLKARGFLEEFAVWYLDRDGKWKQTDSIVVDTANSTVIAYATHFTPFVLTAMPSSTGGVPDGPACLAQDFPSGIGGSAGATFSVVDSNFKYYKDRNYYIVRDAAFDALGFNGALGLAACNGGSPCGSMNQHKRYTGLDYITFTAHTNIDIYVMYDTRGGTGPYAVRKNDLSADAPWLASEGFVDTGFEVRTTDAVTYYTVYKKSYLQGQTVRLHGNRRGVTDPKINTNYWVVMKRMGVTAAGPASTLCEAAPDANPPANVLSLRAAPGATTVRLSWQNPGDLDFAGVVIRRGTGAAPAGPGDGVPATGTVVSPQAYEDAGLASGQTYYYTIFALDTNNNYRPGASAVAVTGSDGDGDGLSDAFETIFNYRAYFPTTLLPELTDMGNPDTDGDGISDGDEFMAGTDPTNSDASAPIVTQFTLSSAVNTRGREISISINGTDDTAITGWLITYSGTAPLSSHPNWSATPPVTHALPPASGSYTLYAWARDVAGNVSTAFVPLNVNLQLGGNVPRFVYTAATDGIRRHEVDIATGELRLIPGLTIQKMIVFDEPKMHPNGNFMYSLDQTRGIVVHRINSTNGSLTEIQTVSASVVDPFSGYIYFYSLTVTPDGENLFASTVPGSLSHFVVDPVTGLLTYKQSEGYQAEKLFTHPNGKFLYFILEATNPDSPGVAFNRFAIDTIVTSNIRLEGIGSVFWSYQNTRLDWLDGSIDQRLRHKFLFNTVHGYMLIARYQNNASDLEIIPVDLDTGVFPGSNGGKIYFAGPVFGFADITAYANLPDFAYLYMAGGSRIATVPGDRSALQAMVNSAAIPYITTLDSPHQMVVDPGGRFLFSLSDTGLATFRPNPVTGIPENRVATATAYTPKSMTLFMLHTENDPPSVDAGGDQYIEVSRVAALSGYRSYDPDAIRCNAVRTNYVYQWTFDSVPAGSALTNANIVNASTLSSASFTPDVRGDYILRLRFTDDPGTCNGPAATTTATVTIKARNVGRFPSSSGSSACYGIVGNPTTPYVGSTEGPVNVTSVPTMPPTAEGDKWYSTRPYYRNEYGILRGWWIRFPTFYLPICSTGIMERSAAAAICKEKSKIRFPGKRYSTYVPYFGLWQHSYYAKITCGFWTWWE